MDASRGLVKTQPTLEPLPASVGEIKAYYRERTLNPIDVSRTELSLSVPLLTEPCS